MARRLRCAPIPRATVAISERSVSEITRVAHKPLLTIQDLHVSYGKAEVVHGVSFTVGEGEFVVLLGRNGAGKSTILNAACGLVPSRSGRVIFGGEDLSRASAR